MGGLMKGNDVLKTNERTEETNETNKQTSKTKKRMVRIFTGVVGTRRRQSESMIKSIFYSRFHPGKGSTPFLPSLHLSHISFYQSNQTPDG